MDKRKKYEQRQKDIGKKMFSARIDRDMSDTIRRMAQHKQMPIAALAESIFRDYIAVSE